MCIVLVMAILAGLSASSVHCRGQLRVYQGEADSLAEFPFAVVLQLKEPFQYRACTGSLIADNWVLTAAHCIADVYPEERVIRYGDFTKPANETKLYSKIIKIYCYPNYMSNLYASLNDIALIFVEKVPNKKLAKLLALDYKTYVGLHVKYAGFGGIQKNYKMDRAVVMKNQYILLQVGEGVVAPCDIRTLYKHSNLCIASKCSKKKQQARQGDSGGPLLYDGKVIGVASKVIGKFTLYTPVSPYLEWIKNTIDSNKF